MPREIFDPVKFVELSKRAVECRVRRKGEVVKLKLRTRKVLYTIKVKPKDVESILSKITCEVKEL